MQSNVSSDVRGSKKDLAFTIDFGDILLFVQ